MHARTHAHTPRRNEKSIDTSPSGEPLAAPPARLAAVVGPRALCVDERADGGVRADRGVAGDQVRVAEGHPVGLDDVQETLHGVVDWQVELSMDDAAAADQRFGERAGAVDVLGLLAAMTL